MANGLHFRKKIKLFILYKMYQPSLIIHVIKLQKKQVVYIFVCSLNKYSFNIVGQLVGI